MGRTACTQPQCLYNGNLYLYTFMGWDIHANTFRTICLKAENLSYITVSSTIKVTILPSGFGGLDVACWPLVPKFAPGRSRRIFRAKKILSMPSFEEEVKLSFPCRSFTACKIYLNVTWKSTFRQNYRTFLAHSYTFRRWVLSCGDTRGDAWWQKFVRLTQIAQ